MFGLGELKSKVIHENGGHFWKGEPFLKQNARLTQWFHWERFFSHLHLEMGIVGGLYWNCCFWFPGQAVSLSFIAQYSTSTCLLNTLLFFVTQYFLSMYIEKLMWGKPRILAKLLGFLGALVSIEFVGGLRSILLIFLGPINLSGWHSTLDIDF